MKKVSEEDIARIKGNRGLVRKPKNEVNFEKHRKESAAAHARTKKLLDQNVRHATQQAELSRKAFLAILKTLKRNEVFLDKTKQSKRSFTFKVNRDNQGLISSVDVQEH